MTDPRAPWRKKRYVSIAAAAFAVFVALALYSFRDNIFRAWMDPRRPFETTQPPAAPDYADVSAWLLRPPIGGGGYAGRGENPQSAPAAVFILPPTAHFTAQSWNGALHDPEAEARLFGSYLPNLAGPFASAGDIWAPRTRQATLAASLTLKEDASNALILAAGDALAALDMFLARTGERPVILVGQEQGGLILLRLLAERFGPDSPHRDRLVAAYVIQHAAPARDFSGAGALSGLGLCGAPDETGCVAVFNPFQPREGRRIERYLTRSRIWTEGGELTSSDGVGLACVNPLTWAADAEFAPARLHKGGVRAEGLSIADYPPVLEQETSAQCRDGVLLVDQPDSWTLRRDRVFGGVYKPDRFNLFYEDLRLNALERLAAWRAGR